MHILELPPEVLAKVIDISSSEAPTRQKRRLRLLLLGRVCKAFSAQSLRKIYQKLAYEISPKGIKLLKVLEANPDRYASLIRAVAVREREGAPQRKIINSYQDDTAISSTPIPTRTRKLVLESVNTEEDRISRVFELVYRNLAELKYETNLLPTSLPKLTNLQSLTVIPQAPFPDSAEHEILLSCATFTLSLPPEIFLPSFLAFQHLTHLDLWKCSFQAFEGNYDILQRPQFRLVSLVLGECIISGPALEWMMTESLKHSSLNILKYSYLQDIATQTHSDARPLREVLKQTIIQAAPKLAVFGFEGDEGALDTSQDDDAVKTHTSASYPFTALKTLKSLSLGGHAITEQHWLSIPSDVLTNLTTLELLFTPKLSPTLLLASFRDMPVCGDGNRQMLIHIHASEEPRRQNIRGLLQLQGQRGEAQIWSWPRNDCVALSGLLASKGISWTGDRALMNSIADDEASSEGDDFDLADMDEMGEFVLTEDQIAFEKQIEAEELERTWESGSEY
ncbi:hypothetical protein EMMF5_004435 [Cystobasidiomycetes sp. EMM_F5]